MSGGAGPAWLFRRFIVRRLATERLRSAVTVFGVAVGIAVVIAIQLTNASSVRGFSTALETVAGRTTLVIAGPGPSFDELSLTDLAWLTKYGDVSPVIEGDALAKTPGGTTEPLRILGIDILRDRGLRDYRLVTAGESRGEQPRAAELLTMLATTNSIVLTEKFAAKTGLSTGDTIELTTGDRAAPFVIRALLADDGPARVLDGSFAIVDIATAQLAFDRLGRVDRVDVQLRDAASVDAAEREIAARLPAGLSVARPEQRGRQVEKMLEAFQFNLAALSYIALIVGLFLIYNTVSISVIARREEIGTLRALGASRRTVLALFLGEAFAIALIGIGIGIMFGRLLAVAAVRLTSTTVNALYIATASVTPPLGVKHVLLALAIGLPLALIAAAVPALEAAGVPPTAALRGADRLETRYRLRAWYIAVPAVLLGLGWWLATLGPVNGLPLFGYASAAAIVFGAASLVPAVLFVACRLIDRPVSRLFGIEGRLANANVSAAIPRIAISVAALSVALAMMVAIAVMIGSFRETVVVWVDQTLRADLYVRPVTRSNVATDSTLSPDVERIAAALSGVDSVDTFRNFDVPYGDGTIIVGSSDIAALRSHRKLMFKAPTDEQMALAAAESEPDAALASESFSLRYGMAIGDSFDLPTATGTRTFRVAGIFYDYSNDRGAVILNRRVFEQAFGPQRPTNLAVYLKEGTDAEAARRELLGALGDRYRVFVFTNGALRREVMRIFDSTFAITYALEVIAIAVAILGVASTLLTLVLERRRELAMLRLVGADHRQVRKMVVIEAAIIGGVSQGVGLAIGILLSLVLVYVINVQSFGWTIQFRIPWAFLLQSSVLIIVATALSGIYPARRATRLDASAQTAEE